MVSVKQLTLVACRVKPVTCVVCCCRGLVVAVKVVSVGDPSNERAVMKNAHEIAILRSSSHPNIIQAYSCLTDVRVRDVIALCTRWVVWAWGGA
jgi:serine/threonine protein kinase